MSACDKRSAVSADARDMLVALAKSMAGFVDQVDAKTSRSLLAIITGVFNPYLRAAIQLYETRHGTPPTTLADLDAARAELDCEIARVESLRSGG